MLIGPQVSQDILVLFQALASQANIHQRFGFMSGPSPGHWPGFFQSLPFTKTWTFSKAWALTFARFQNEATKAKLEPKLHVWVVDMSTICRHEAAKERSR